MIVNVAEQLKESPLFSGISLVDLESLVKLMHQQTYPAGTVLVNKGEPGESMFVILSGRVRIFMRDPHGHDFTLVYYGKGRIFGELSLIDNQARSASAMAVETLEVLVLHRDVFLAFLPQCPALGLAMIRNMAERVRHITLYLNKVNGFLHRLSRGDYEQAIREISISSGDVEIQEMIATYIQMVRSVQARASQVKSTP